MLRDELRNTPWAKSGHRMFVLVDPALADPFQDAPNRKMPLPVVHENLRGAHRPYLMQCNLRGSVFDLSVDTASQEAGRLRDDLPGARTVCGWLFTSASADRLAEHLACHASLPSSQGARLFRYWDPRVMDLMRTMLSPRQARGLMGPVLGWCWTGRDRHLRAIAGTGQDSDGHAAFQLTDEQRAWLSQAPHVNRAMDVLQDMGYDMASVDPSHLARCICQGQRAWGFSQEHEHVTYALHCLLVHEQFDRLPEVRNAMVAETERGHSAIEALDRFGDAYWQDLANSQSGMAQP
ncbi:MULTISPECIES: DUF4123 domain-containing protein [Cupriavidus]